MSAEDDISPDHPCFDNDDDMVDDEIEDFFDCGLMPDGICMRAGTEDCDWECPHRMELMERRLGRRKTDEPGPLL